MKIVISRYFNTNDITKGLLISFLLSVFIYLEYFGISYKFINTTLAIIGLYLLLENEKQSVWFWSGFFIALLWFWWITLSFRIYGIAWAIPFGVIGIGLIEGFIFLIGCKVAILAHRHLKIPTIFWLAFFLLGVNYIAPFGFDWLKLQLLFLHSYLGVALWQFGIIILAITLSIYKKNLLFLVFVVLAYTPHSKNTPTLPTAIEIAGTNIGIKEKWDETHQINIINDILSKIDNAIVADKKLIIFPESTIARFINEEPDILGFLTSKSQDISVIIGALYWDGETPRNSTYLFNKNEFTTMHKVVLVPFGEYNPLPDFIGKWINKVIYNDGVDYKPVEEISDYEVNGITYRNAICFEATKPKMYEGDPKFMIAISNNKWFTPSIEPTLQRLLIEYYSQLFGTTIYHAINGSPSYITSEGKSVFVEQ
ncbi:MAG: apolipoprotein N-acyltransferase [Campylobacterales bacterium]|nr:apolipoprotein N-acyltransferase [Campylobacterales bacterium]